jgi:hypothetical protein
VLRRESVRGWLTKHYSICGWVFLRVVSGRVGQLLLLAIRSSLKNSCRNTVINLEQMFHPPPVRSTDRRIHSPEIHTAIHRPRLTMISGSCGWSPSHWEQGVGNPPRSRLKCGLCGLRRLCAGYEGSDAPTRGSAGVRPVRRPCTNTLQ